MERLCNAIRMLKNDKRCFETLNYSTTATNKKEMMFDV
jgi:hypothetical protein